MKTSLMLISSHNTASTLVPVYLDEAGAAGGIEAENVVFAGYSSLAASAREEQNQVSPRTKR